MALVGLIIDIPYLTNFHTSSLTNSGALSKDILVCVHREGNFHWKKVFFHFTMDFHVFTWKKLYLHGKYKQRLSKFLFFS